MEILSTTKYFDREGGHEYEIEITNVRLDPEMFNQHLEYTRLVTDDDCETMEEILAINEYRKKQLQKWKQKLSEALGYDDFPGHIFITGVFQEFYTVVHTKRIR